MDKREFLKLMLLSPALALYPSFSQAGCYPSGIVYTKQDPGKWKNKIRSHIPKIRIENRRVTIITHHPMSKSHYIVRHTLVLQDGRVVGERTFQPSESEARSDFYLPEGYKGRIYATSFCNLHDLWVNMMVVR